MENMVSAHIYFLLTLVTDVLKLVTGYMSYIYIRLRLNPACNYLLVCRNGKQVSKPYSLSSNKRDRKY